MKLKIQNGSVQETLMLPLYGRAYCSQKYPTLFPDKVSEEMAAKIDYDFDSLEFKEFAVITWAIRKRMLNERVKAFLMKHPKATIINLGCGADVSFPDVDNGQCRYINLDLPEVIAAREQLVPCLEREKNIAIDAFDTAWCDMLDAPVSDGVYIISGGVFYYFKPEQIKTLFTTLAGKFPGGGIYFDCESSWGIKNANKMVEKTGNTGAKMYFSVDDAEMLFRPWSDRFGSITTVDRLPDSIAKAKEIPGSAKLILKLGCRLGIMKFVEILFQE